MEPDQPVQPAHEEHEHDDDEDMTFGELAESNNFVLSALIDLLIKKGHFSKEEFEQAMADLDEAEDGDEDDDPEGVDSEASAGPDEASQRPGPLG